MTVVRKRGGTRKPGEEKIGKACMIENMRESPKMVKGHLHVLSFLWLRDKGEKKGQKRRTAAENKEGCCGRAIGKKKRV